MARYSLFFAESAIKPQANKQSNIATRYMRASQLGVLGNLVLYRLMPFVSPIEQCEITDGKMTDRLSKGKSITRMAEITMVKRIVMPLVCNSRCSWDDFCAVAVCIGIQQAERTGQWLAELELPYSTIIHSTMSRARETANVIQRSLPSIQMSESDLLREGAPYPPEPPLRYWKPDYRVCGIVHWS